MKRCSLSLALLVFAATPALAQSEGSIDEVVVEEWPAPHGAEPPRESAAPPDAAREQPVTADTLASLLARYAHEPSVDEVIKAALAAAALDPDRFANMARRARLRGVVPIVEVGARRGQGINLSSATAASAGGIQLKTADDLMLEASLRFDPARLLFATEEVGIAREARWDRRARMELVRELVRTYFLRKRLLLERDLRGHTDVDHEVRIAEAEALLDAFTNGAFQRMMGASRSAWTTDASTGVSPRR